MELLQNYKGNYAIKNFHPLSIYFLKKYYPNVIRGQISSSFTHKKMNPISKFVLKYMLFNFMTKPDFISYDICGVSPSRIHKMRKKRFILGWTIRNKKDFESSKPLFDNLICENMKKYIKK